MLNTHIHILTQTERQGIAIIGDLFLFSSLQFSIFSKLFVGRINVFRISRSLLILLSQRQSVYVVPGASADHQACCHQAQILSTAHPAAERNSQGTLVGYGEPPGCGNLKPQTSRIKGAGVLGAEREEENEALSCFFFCIINPLTDGPADRDRPKREPGRNR